MDSKDSGLETENTGDNGSSDEDFFEKMRPVPKQDIVGDFLITKQVGWDNVT